MFTNSFQPCGFTHRYRNMYANATIVSYCHRRKTICQKQVNARRIVSTVQKQRFRLLEALLPLSRKAASA